MMSHLEQAYEFDIEIRQSDERASADGAIILATDIAEGVDLLVHEVAAPETFQRAGVSSELAMTIVAHHITAERAGELFSRVKPKLAVYSHIVRSSATEQDLIPPTTNVQRIMGGRKLLTSLSGLTARYVDRCRNVLLRLASPVETRNPCIRTSSSGTKLTPM